MEQELVSFPPCLWMICTSHQSWLESQKLHWIYKIRSIFSDSVLQANDSGQWMSRTSLSISSHFFFFFHINFEYMNCLGIHYHNFRSSSISTLTYRIYLSYGFAPGLNMIFTTAPHPPLSSSLCALVPLGRNSRHMGWKTFLCLPKSALIRVMRRLG